MSDQIHYDYAGIQGLMQQASSEHQQLVQLTQDLDGVRNQTAQLWTDPSSAEAFQQVYQKWIQSSNEVQGVLHAIINAAQNGSSSMEDTNKTIASGWG